MSTQPEYREVEQTTTFKIITPTGLMLTIPQNHMPSGFGLHNTEDLNAIAKNSAKRLGLKVIVERKRAATATPPTVTEKPE